MGPQQGLLLLPAVLTDLPIHAEGDSQFTLPQQQGRGRRTNKRANVTVNFLGGDLTTEADGGGGVKQIFIGNACKTPCPQAPHVPNRKNKSKVKFDTTLYVQTVNGTYAITFHTYLQQIP